MSVTVRGTVADILLYVGQTTQIFDKVPWMLKVGMFHSQTH